MLNGDFRNDFTLCAQSRWYADFGSMERMSASLKALGIERLSVEQRISLVEEIWDSIAEATPLTEAQRLELDRRLQDHEANPEDVVPWEVVKASITARLKG
jgi:putative addiction module component (TIGR02574 family)